MPIEVEGPDGSVIEFPDNTSQQVMQRAMADKFGGPQAPAAPKPGKVAVGRPAPKSSALRPQDAQAALDSGSAALEAKIAKLPPKYQQMARDKYFSDSRVADLRVASAKKAPAAPKNNSGRDTMLRTVLRANPMLSPLSNLISDDALSAGQAGVSRGLFGIPERIAAGAKYLVNNEENQDYGNILADIRKDTDEQGARSATGYIAGNVLSSIAGGGLASSAARGVGAKLAASGGGRAVQAAGRALEGSATLRNGQKWRNAAKLVGAGTAAGAAQAAGEGSDVTTGAAIGAGSAAVLPPLAKGLAFMARPAADFLRMTDAPKLLRRFTNASADDIERAVAKHRADTGSEPTLYEVLPLEDRNNLAAKVVQRSPGTAEQVAAAVRQRVANVGPELQANARQATAPRRQEINTQMASDMEEVAGARPGVLPAGYGADRSPLAMKGFQQAEANAVMAPHENTVVSDDLKELFPTSFRTNSKGEVEEVFSDPEVVAAINSAAGTLKLRPKVGTDSADVEGLTAGDASRILRNLAKIEPGATNKEAAMKAERIIMDHMDRKFPEASAAVARMRSTYARRARTLEGMNEGGMTRTQESVRLETSKEARKLRNAYQTPEGEAGRFLGQSNAVAKGFNGRPVEAISAAGDIAESGQTQAALRANLGREAAERIIRASETQTQSVRNLGSLSKAKADVADSASPEDIGLTLLALSPSSMVRTKAWAITRMLSGLKMPEVRAQQLADMLFSQNPAVTNRAIALLRKAGKNGNAVISEIGRGAAQAVTGNSEAGSSDVPPPPADDGLSGTVTDDGNYEAPAAEAEDGVQEFGDYQEMLDAELDSDPEFEDLWMRQTNQESGRKQFDASGSPLTSSAGAIGVAQVMPDTAPEAARLAGLEWDEEAYRTDPAYNELLGIAYMKEMLRKFDGDVELALAAYNAGPGAVQEAGNRVPQITETQDYVDRIMAGG